MTHDEARQQTYTLDEAAEVLSIGRDDILKVLP